MSPLTRESITSASRVTLVLYPVLCLCQGLSYTFGDQARFNTPSMDFVLTVMPLRTWGITFLLLGLGMLAGYGTRSRDVTVFVLYASAMAYTIWASLFALALLERDDTALMGPVWPLFAAGTMAVTARSLAKLEVSARGPTGEE